VIFPEFFPVSERPREKATDKGKKLMAEWVGFEPRDPLGPNGFQYRRSQPPHRAGRGKFSGGRAHRVAERTYRQQRAEYVSMMQVAYYFLLMILAASFSAQEQAFGQEPYHIKNDVLGESLTAYENNNQRNAPL
jgi:hypothetical protein